MHQNPVLESLNACNLQLVQVLDLPNEKVPQMQQQQMNFNMDLESQWILLKLENK